MIKIHTWIERLAERRVERLEQLCAAYYKQTNIAPDKVMLVEERRPTETRWYFKEVE